MGDFGAAGVAGITASEQEDNSSEAEETWSCCGKMPVSGGRGCEPKEPLATVRLRRWVPSLASKKCREHAQISVFVCIWCHSPANEHSPRPGCHAAKRVDRILSVLCVCVFHNKYVCIIVDLFRMRTRADVANNVSHN